MARYGVFTEPDARKVADAARRVLAVPATRTILRQPQQTIRQTSLSPSEDVASDFPEGVTCDCSHCISGVTIPGATVCCTSHLSWDFVDPWTGDARILKWIGGDQWATDPFSAETDEGCSNEYVWLMDLTAGTLALTIAVDNGCDKACIVYKVVNWFKCQCDNPFDLFKHENVDVEDLACRACVKPREYGSVDCDAAQISLPVILSVSGFSGDGVIVDFTCDCTLLDRGAALSPDTFIFDAFCQISAEHLDYAVDRCCFNGIFSVAECQGQGLNNALFAPLYSVKFLFDDNEVTIAAQIRPHQLLDGWHFRETFTIDELKAGGSFELTYFETATDPEYCTPPSTVTVTLGASPIVTSDGSCDTCGEPDTAPIDEEGACCAGGECLDIAEADCATIGGTWHATDVECDAECGALGTCCACVNEVVTCVGSATSEQCDGLGGAWTQDYGAACNNVDLEITNDCGGSLGNACVAGESFGACCCYDGACANMVPESTCYDGSEENDCSFHGTSTGEFTPDTDCADVTCTPADVGCCSDDGALETCEDKTEAQCLADHPTGWTWTGPPAQCCVGASVICDTDGLGQGVDPC